MPSGVYERKVVPVEERVWRMVDKASSDNGCWLWSGSINKGGYGVVGFGRSPQAGRSALAHRFVYELLVEPVPVGMVLDHICRTRHCVNPEHLELTTQKRNLERQGLSPRNTSGVRGVYLNKAAGKWQVNVTHYGKQHYGGLFTDLAEAEKAAIALRSRLFGDDPIRREKVPA